MKICLAPMHGVTDYIYRNAHMEVYGGIDFGMAPFIRTGNGKKVNKNRLKDVLPENNPKLKIIPQILSNNIDQFVVLANELYDIGYSEINLNMGCPYPMVTKKGSGAGMLLDLDKTANFLESIITAIPNRLSLKTRTGFNSHDELPAIVSLLNRFEFESVTVHPRTAVQMYKGEVEPDAFEYCQKYLHHPLMYNGDILSLNDFCSFQYLYPKIDHWMLGRGILIDPALPLKIKGEVFSEKKLNTMFLKFHEQLLHNYLETIVSEHHVLDKMKCLWEYWNIYFDDPVLYKSIRKCHKLDLYKLMVKKIGNY